MTTATSAARLAVRDSAATVLTIVTAFAGAPNAPAEIPAPAAADLKSETTKSKGPLLLPDLEPLKASHLSLQREGESRKVRFDSRLANLGVGPMEVRPSSTKGCGPGRQRASQILYRDKDRNGVFKRSVDKRFVRRSAGCTLYHPAHEHWHFAATALYSISKPTESKPIIVRSRKMSFCLRDSERVPARFGTYNTRQYYGACSKRSPQGISRGWLDLYTSDLVGQALKVPTRIPNGVYCLGIRVDPLNRLREGDESNQSSVRSFRLKQNRVSPAPKRLCSGGPG